MEELECVVGLLRVQLRRGAFTESQAKTVAQCIAGRFRKLHCSEAMAVEVSICMQYLFTRHGGVKV